MITNQHSELTRMTKVHFNSIKQQNTYKHFVLNSLKLLKTINKRDKVSILTNKPLWYRSNTALKIINIHSFSSFWHTQIALFLVLPQSQKVRMLSVNETQCGLSKLLHYSVTQGITPLQHYRLRIQSKHHNYPNMKLMSGSYFIPKSKGKNKKLYFAKENEAHF